MEVDLGVRSYSAWWQIGKDVQQSQGEICKSETGRSVLLMMSGCAVARSGIEKEDRLHVLPNEYVPAVFTERAAEYLQTDDIVVIQDTGTAALMKVVACAVPGEWWRRLTADEQDDALRHDDDNDNDNDNTDEPEPICDGEQMELDFDYEDSEISPIAEPAPAVAPIAAPRRTTTPPAPIAAPKPSFFERVARHCKPESRYMQVSLWSGKAETYTRHSTLTWAYMIGVMVICVLWYEISVYVIDHYACYDFAPYIYAFLVACAVWTVFSLWFGHRVKKYMKSE